MTDNWIQIKGDPSIRRFVFEQERSCNEFDQQIKTVLSKVASLIKCHGVFHAKIHFSSGQVTLWLADDPLRYRVYVNNEFIELDLNTMYSKQLYGDYAIMDSAVIDKVFEGFKQLRMRDPQVYLRSGSINIANGMVGLNFSCDGSHYMSYREFLRRLEEI